jgi:diguanylate cyclase
LQNSATHLAGISKAALVHTDKIRLLYAQSFQGVLSAFIVAIIWSAMMWGQAAHHALLIWIGAISLATCLRLILFLLYRQRVTDDNLAKWSLPYSLTVIFSSCVWGFGTVLVMPPESLLHQAITYLILIGLAGAALSAYGVFQRMTIAIVAAVTFPIIVFFFLENTRITLLLGVAGAWFFATTLRALRIHNKTLEDSFLRAYDLNEAKQIAEQQARTDSLTGLSNRRAFVHAAAAVLRINAREHSAATMLVIDIDNFKQINDNHGHKIGDGVLMHVAEVLRTTLRTSDICGRMGGDEFAVLLPNTDLAAAQDVANKIRQRIDEDPLNIDSGALPFTLSIGVADDAHDVETLLNHADMQMYRAKRSGKNSVVSSGTDKFQLLKNA